MGCCGTKNSEESQQQNQNGKGNQISITIVHPKTQKQMTFQYEDDEGKSQDLLMNVMNALCFGKGKDIPAQIDGNFISIYNQQTDRFHYFCHRLQGIEIEFPDNPYSGKMWIPYINNKKEDWDNLIENNQKISLSNTKILWKYENSEGRIIFQKTNSGTISSHQIDVQIAKGQNKENIKSN